jgi:acyl dehydratase
MSINPTMAGAEFDEVTFPVERSKIAELARALGDDDPVYRDPAAAREAGFEQVPAPPTATVLIDHWGERGLAQIAQEDLGLDLERVLHGESAWEYIVPVRAGDELTARRRVGTIASREGKRGGTMILVTIDSEFVNQRGELAVRRTDTLIERSA